MLLPILYLMLPVLLVIIPLACWKGPGATLSITNVVGMIGIGLILINPAVGLWFLLIGLIGLWAWIHETKTRSIVVSWVLATLVSLSILGYIGYQHMLKVIAERESYPVEMMELRLAYEKKRSDPEGNKTTATLDRLLSFEQRVKQAPVNLDHAMRLNRLERIHDSTVSIFVASPGFGVGRKISLPYNSNFNYVPGDDSHRNEWPFAQPDSTETYLQMQMAPRDSKPPTPAQKVLDEMHLASAVDFIHRGGFGVEVEENKIAGFESHQFGEMPTNPQKDWHILRIDLVSLLKFESPRVYMSEHLPRMDELKDAPTRPLTPFEQDGLKTLRAGEDLKIEQHGSHMYMMGSLRAGKQCLQCHSVERGDLLGAFSYHLQWSGAK